MTISQAPLSNVNVNESPRYSTNGTSALAAPEPAPVVQFPQQPAQPPLNSMASLYQKIARVMGRLHTIPKTGHNKFHDYKYATASDVSDSIRQAMAAENLALFMQVIGKEVENDRLYVYYKFTFACGDTGATMECDWQGEVSHYNKNSIDDKSLNKCATTARKYFLMSTFQVSTGDEEDADSEPNKPRNQSQSKQQSQSRPQQSAQSPAKWNTDNEVEDFMTAAEKKANLKPQQIAMLLGMTYPVISRDFDKFPSRAAAGEALKTAIKAAESKHNEPAPLTAPAGTFKAVGLHVERRSGSATAFKLRFIVPEGESHPTIEMYSRGTLSGQFGDDNPIIRERVQTWIEGLTEGDHYFKAVEVEAVTVRWTTNDGGKPVIEEVTRYDFMSETA